MGMKTDFPRTPNGNVDWAAMGVEWETETVKKAGTEYAGAEICVPSNLDNIRKFVTDDTILGSLDGTSWRVAAQDVNRATLADWKQRGTKLDDTHIELLRVRVWQRLMGIRGERRPAAVKIVEKIVERKMYALPDGTMWVGEDMNDYGAMYTAALVDQGVPASVATAIAHGMIAKLQD